MKIPFSQHWSYFLAELHKWGFLSLVTEVLKSVYVTHFSGKKNTMACTHLTASVWDCGC